MKKVITAYFSGTGFRIDNDGLLAANLYQASLNNENQSSFGFNGTGVDYGIGGTIWGTGIDEQCQQVIQQVEAELKAGHQVTLNAYGHSRGGIAALLLAKQLGQANLERLEVNLALLDPVPGNLITTSSSDFLNISLANKTMDLSDCQTLKNVLAIYPYGPLAAIMCHAPLLPTYPSCAEVHEDVSLGTHAQAENMYIGDINLVVTKQVYDFLNQHGSQFDETKLSSKFTMSDEDMLYAYIDFMSMNELVPEQSSRAAHSAHDSFIEVTTDESKPYFNRHHQKLVGVADDPETRMASIKQSKGLWVNLKNALKNNPIITNTIKWSVIGAGLAASVFFTGGLAAIPYMAGLVAKIGFTSAFLGSSVLLGGVSAGIWQ